MAKLKPATNPRRLPTLPINNDMGNEHSIIARNVMPTPIVAYLACVARLAPIIELVVIMTELELINSA